MTATVRAAGTVLLLAYASPTLFAYFLFQCAVGAVESLALRWYLHRRLPLAVASPRFNVQALQSIWRFAAGLAAIAFLATLLTQVDKLLLAKMLTLEQFGYFTVAITLASALSVLIAPINNVAFPVLSEGVATGDTSSLASHYHKFAQLLSIGIFPLAIVLCLFSENILFLWTGDSGTAFAVAPLLSVWVIGTALNGLMHVPYAAQLAHGWSQLSLMLNTVAVLIMVPAMVFLVPRHGAIAAAWIWVAINVGYMVFGIAAMHRRILKREKWKWYLQDVLGPLAASAFTAVGMSALHSKVQGLSRLEELCFLMAATAVLLFAATAAVPLGRQFLMSAANLVKERTACATDK